MIPHDQPTYFPEDLLVAVSSKQDGTVLDRAVGIHDPGIVTNRTKFCDANGVSYGDMVYQRINYGDKETYDRIVHVTEADTTKHVSEIAADALITDIAGVGLLLPVADCVATVVYDVRKKRLALLHLGRHSTLANLMDKVLREFINRGSGPADLQIWMAPSVQKSHYALDYFTGQDDPAWQGFFEEKEGKIYIDMQGYNRQSALDLGVPESQIVLSTVNTASDENYFSHSNGDTTGRFAVLAMIKK